MNRFPLWKNWLLWGLALLLIACGGPRVIRIDESADELWEVIFAPDGSAFLVGDRYNRFIQLRTFPQGKPGWRLEGPGYEWGPTAMAFSPDGAEVALAYDERILFYTAADGSPAGEISLGDDVLYVPFLAYRPDGALAVVVGREGEKPMSIFVEVWSREGERVGEPLHLPPCYTATMERWRPFTPDGSRLVYQREAHILGIVDVAQGESWEWDLKEPLHFDDYPNELSILSLAVSPDGQEVALGLSRRPNNTLAEPPVVLRVEADTGRVIAALPAPEGLRDGDRGSWWLAYSPNGQSLAVALYEPLSSPALLLYQVEKAESRLLCEGEDCCADYPAFSPDGETLATVCGDRIALWEVSSSLSPTATSPPSPSPTATSPPSPTPSPAPSPTAPPSSPFRPASWPGEEIRHLWVAPDGQLWLTTNAGIFVRSDEAWEALYDGPAERVLGADTAGRVWALLEDEETVAAYEPAAATWSVFGPDQGWTAPPPYDYLSPGYGDGLVTDPRGRVWLATGRDNLRRFDPQTQTWTTFRAADLGFAPPEKEGYQGHFLTDVALDGAGNVWVGDCIGMGEVLLGQGVRRFDGERWHEAAETTGECVYDIEVDDAGRVWIGGFDALIRYDPATGTWSRIPLPPWERPQLVTEITLDTDGNPWVELLRFGGASPFGEVARYHLEEGVWVADYDPGGEWFGSLAFGPDGVAWLCAEGTVYRLAGGQTEEVGTVAAPRCQIEVDGAGRVWVAGDSGLWWLDPGGFPRGNDYLVVARIGEEGDWKLDRAQVHTRQGAGYGLGGIWRR